MWNKIKNLSEVNFIMYSLVIITLIFILLLFLINKGMQGINLYVLQDNTEALMLYLQKMK